MTQPARVDVDVRVHDITIRAVAAGVRVTLHGSLPGRQTHLLTVRADLDLAVADELIQAVTGAVAHARTRRSPPPTPHAR